MCFLLAINSFSFSFSIFAFQVRPCASQSHFITLSQLIGSWETGELSEAITRYAQFNIKYEQLELLHEPGIKSFPHELVEVLFLKRYGFDISFYQAPQQRWGVNLQIPKLEPRRLLNHYGP